MNIARLMCVEKEEFANSLGEDRILIVRGGRAAYQWNQSSSRSIGIDGEEDVSAEQGHEFCECNGDPDIPIGGSRLRKPVETSTQTSLADRYWTKSRGTQTRQSDLYLDSKSKGKRHRKEKILIGVPRDILENWKAESSTEEPPQLPQKSNRESIDSGSQTKNPNFLMEGKAKLSVSNVKAGLSNLTKAVKSLFTAQLISLDTSEPELSDLEEYPPEEQDGKWLEFTSSSSNTDHELEEIMAKAKTKRFLPVEPQSYQLNKEMWWLNIVMRFLGRWPFTSYIKNRLIQYELNKRSNAFIAFCITTVIVFLITFLSTCNFLFIFVIRDTKKGLPFPEYAEEIELEKYWPFVMYHLIFGLYVSFWSVLIIFYDGRRISEYLSRMSHAVFAIRCERFDDIQLRIGIAFAYIIVYTCIVVLIFITDYIPTVRGSCGLFGDLIFRSYHTELRTSKYYFWVRVLGLLTHLYFVISEKLITVFLTINCKFVDNLASRWNLRLAYSLGFLEQFDQNERGSGVEYKTKLSYNKLLAEHKITTTFSRMAGTVYASCFTIYLAFKCAETSLLGYRFLVYLTVPSESSSRYNETYLTGGIYENPDDKVKLEDPFHISFFCIFTLLVISVVNWIWTSIEFAEPGKTILAGFGFIRRHGYINSKSSKQTRFLMSLNAEINSNNADQNPGYLINRRFMTGTGLWQFFFILALLAFNPFKVSHELEGICKPGAQTDVICTKYSEFANDIVEPSLVPVNVEEKRESTTQKPEGGGDVIIMTTTPDPATATASKLTTSLLSTTKPTTTTTTKATTTITTTVEPTTTITTTTKPTTTTTTTTQPTTTTTTTTQPTTTTTTTTKPTTTSVTTTTAKPQVGLLGDVKCLNEYKNLKTINATSSSPALWPSCDFEADWYKSTAVKFALPLACQKNTANNYQAYVPDNVSNFYYKWDTAFLFLPENGSQYSTCPIKGLGSPKDTIKFDDCKNPSMLISQYKKETVKRATILFDGETDDYKPRLFCCYDYELPGDSYKYCSSSKELVFKGYMDKKTGLESKKCTSSKTDKFSTNYLAKILLQAIEFGLVPDKDVSFWLWPKFLEEFRSPKKGTKPECKPNEKLNQTTVQMIINKFSIANATAELIIKKFHDLTDVTYTNIEAALKYTISQKNMDKCYCNP